MNDLKKRAKTKNFWMMLVAALILVLRALGLEMEQELTRICDGICGCLVSIGLFTSPIGESEKNAKDSVTRDEQTQDNNDE